MYDREKSRLFKFKAGCFKTPSLGELIHAYDPYATDLDELEKFMESEEGKKIAKEVEIK